nr:retrovirus-related Pol polyprotein from transposon TNT 1-94 [Tanacetum cinerariifolium]
MLDEFHALSKPVTSNSVSAPQESKVVNNDKVIAPGLFRINPFKTSREEKHVPNTIRASAKTKPITVSQPPVFTKKDVNSDSNALSSTGNVISKVVCAMWQFYDSDLEVAFRRNACSVRNLEGVDLLKGDHSTNLYTINLHEMASALAICLMARASSTKSWLWHQRLPKFKYHKEHLCPSCEQGKRKRASHPPKPVPNSRQRLHLLHMDLYGPMRIASINEKRIYNRRTKKIMETMNVSFDELLVMDFEQRSSKPGLQTMTSGQISSGLDLTYALSTITTQQPTEGELDLLFEAMYDDYIGGQPSATTRTISPAQEPQVRQMSTASTSIADTTPTPTNSSSHATIILITSQDFDELNTNALFDGNTFVNPFANPYTSATESSSS